MSPMRRAMPRPTSAIPPLRRCLACEWLILMLLVGWLAGCSDGLDSAEPSGPADEIDANVVLCDLAGQSHEPLACAAGDVHVLIFVTRDCPIANSYLPEIQRIMTEHEHDPVRFFIVHTDSDIEVAQAREHAQEYGIRCPVLIDAERRLVHAVGASVTPEAAVVTASASASPSGRTFDLRYRGRIDDLYAGFGNRRAQASSHDLRNAIAATLAGRPVAKPKTKAIGCYIPAP